jgi:2-iminobutanoate/2-iminopropanoate deaminase
MRVIQTPHAPVAAGHYSQAIVHDGLVYVAGQLPKDPLGTELGPQSIEEQTERAMRNVEAILLAAGSRLDLMLQMTVYIADMSQWGLVNATLARLLGDHRPARAIVPTPGLHHDYKIEIQAIAAIDT